MPRTQRQANRKVRARPAGSVDPGEIEKFSALADEWWDTAGRFRPLHKLNPVRLAYIRQRALAHFSRNEVLLRPFDGLSLLDIGCGGGLLSEPLARLGFAVTGADPSQANISSATQHARGAGLAIDYHCTTAEELAASGNRFDVIVGMEVVEHVADIDAFLGSCAALVRPGGLLFLATINKTIKSLALAKLVAEYVLGWIPAGTHDWAKFVPPARLRAALTGSDFAVLDTQGIAFNPIGWDWRLSTDTNVNYMLAAARIS